MSATTQHRTDRRTADHPQPGVGRLSTSHCDDDRPRAFISDPSLPGLSFGRILRSEFAKLTALRSTLWLSIASIVLTGLMVTMMLYSLAWLISQEEGFFDSLGQDEVGQELLNQNLMSGTFFAFILIGCIGVLSVTSEFGSGSIRSALAAVPRRLTLVGAKTAAVALFSAVVGLVLILGIAAATALFAVAQDVPMDFGAVEVWQMIGANVLMVVAAGLMGQGLGLILRSSAGAIIVLAALLFGAPMALNIITIYVQDNPLVELLQDWQFGALLDSARDFGQMPGFAGEISAPAAMAGVAVWLAVVLGLGALLFRRRDV